MTRSDDDTVRDREPPPSDQLRQAVIREVLRDRELPVTLDELTDRIYQWEVTNPRTLYSRQDLREHLHDVDLPALEEQGVLEFDRERGLVVDPGDGVDGGGSDRGSPSGDDTTAATDPDGFAAQRYAAVVAVTAVCFAASALDVWVFGAVAPAVVAGAGLVTVAAVAAVDWTVT